MNQWNEVENALMEHCKLLLYILHTIRVKLSFSPLSALASKQCYGAGPYSVARICTVKKVLVAIICSR